MKLKKKKYMLFCVKKNKQKRIFFYPKFWNDIQIYWRIIETPDTGWFGSGESMSVELNRHTGIQLCRSADRPWQQLRVLSVLCEQKEALQVCLLKYYCGPHITICGHIYCPYLGVLIQKNHRRLIRKLYKAFLYLCKHIYFS